jgi:hypothetical protein
MQRAAPRPRDNSLDIFTWFPGILRAPRGKYPGPLPPQNWLDVPQSTGKGPGYTHLPSVDTRSGKPRDSCFALAAQALAGSCITWFWDLTLPASRREQGKNRVFTASVQTWARTQAQLDCFAYPNVQLIQRARLGMAALQLWHAGHKPAFSAPLDNDCVIDCHGCPPGDWAGDWAALRCASLSLIIMQVRLRLAVKFRR